MRVLVTGGAGYIGSHTVRELITAGHHVIVFDNLSNGHLEAVDLRAEFIYGSTGNYEQVKTILISDKIEAVIHFAAHIEVAESVSDPYKYYVNNFSNALSLLNAMKDCGVQKFVFSSTAAVYGNPEKTPITEDQIRNPINPYGRSKMMTEMAIEDFCKAYGLSYTILRYFNVAGASPLGEIGEDHHPETHLIPRILAAALQPDAVVKIYGTNYPTADGTCVRDYVHVDDLAQAHILALSAMKVKSGEIFNVGSENGFSVREVIAACEKVTGNKLFVTEEPRRAGDPAVLVASNKKIKAALGWNPLYTKIETSVQHAWHWHSRHPEGYKKMQFPTSEYTLPDPNLFMSL